MADHFGGDDVETFARKVALRDRTAVARALNLTEDRRVECKADLMRLFAALRSHGGIDRAHRIGITGPPGVGKSTLVAQLARAIRKEGSSVGVLAVDPSSAQSGGALLGDRARISPDPEDKDLFVRSLAAAGELGGLARSVPLGVVVLSAAFDVVFVETVGVGQSEGDVRNVADSVAFVVQPGSGDVLQFLKAGIMEVPDVFVVNKSDEAAMAKRAARDLTHAIASLTSASVLDREPSILMTSARDGTGIDELVVNLREHRKLLESNGELARARRAGDIAWGVRAFVRSNGERGVEALGGEMRVAELLAEKIASGSEVLDAVDAIAT